MPASGSIRRRQARATVDLPQPDSPTMPSASPGATENDTPSRARTATVFGTGQPRFALKVLARSRTTSNGSPVVGAVAVMAPSPSSAPGAPARRAAGSAAGAPRASPFPAGSASGRGRPRAASARAGPRPGAAP